MIGQSIVALFNLKRLIFSRSFFRKNRYQSNISSIDTLLICWIKHEQCINLFQLTVSGRGAAQAAEAGEKAAWGIRAEKEKTFAIYR